MTVFPATYNQFFEFLLIAVGVGCILFTVAVIGLISQSKK